jgi:hypothetical protein
MRPEFGPGHLNNIDLLLTLGYAFTEAVTLLERWLHVYDAKQKPPDPSPQK